MSADDLVAHGIVIGLLLALAAVLLHDKRRRDRELNRITPEEQQLVDWLQRALVPPPEHVRQVGTDPDEVELPEEFREWMERKYGA